MTILIKDIPKEERPRERVLKYGVESLSNIELLAIILKSGTKELSSKDLATILLNRINKLENLKDLTIPKLLEIKGIGTTKAIEIISCIELGKRLFLDKEYSSKEILNHPKKIYESCKSLFIDKKQEYFYCLYFNNKCELLERKLLFMGTVNKSVVHPREIFKEAYLLSASSIVCMHNHPSGNINPSKEDIYFTKNLVKIGKIQDIKVVDHIIVGERDYYSFLEHNILDI